MNVLKESENIFLKRKDIIFTIDHEGKPTPKKSEIEEKIAEKYKVEKDKIEIVYIFSERGKPTSKIKARIWEQKPIKKKEKKEEENETQTN